MAVVDVQTPGRGEHSGLTEKACDPDWRLRSLKGSQRSEPVLWLEPGVDSCACRTSFMAL